MSVAIITGASRGLGRALAAGLADAGWRLVVDARGADDLAAAVDEISSGEIVAVPGDVTDAAHRLALLAAADRLGGLDLLVNNAGASWWGLPQDIPLKGWRKVMDINVTGTFLACRHAARHMIANGGGAIVNIASVGAFISYRPEDGQVVPYTTSKAAIVHLTSDLAAQWAGHGIRVNAIAPGSIETGMTETLDPAIQDKTRAGILLGRFGRPEEVSGTLALLASDAGSFITGQTFLVDGGQSLG